MEVSSIKLTSIALSMARECDVEEEDNEDDEEKVEGGGEGGREGTQHQNRSQHNNKNNKNNDNNNNNNTSATSCNNPYSNTPFESNTKTSSSGPQGSITTKYTQHKWDTELSRRKLLLLYYLVRGKTFNRYLTHVLPCGVLSLLHLFYFFSILIS